MNAPFKNIKTISDLAVALEVPASVLTYYAYGIPDADKYHVFEIKKRNGDLRTIEAPMFPLKKIQSKLSLLLDSGYRPRAHVHGYVKEKDIMSNADIHKSQRWVLRVDFRKFFPSITSKRTRGLFRAFPYNYSKEVADLIARICCFRMTLPHGAPTSPLISNLICRRLDKLVALKAAEHRSRYTRYCDDLTFSTNRRHFPAELAIFDAQGVANVGRELSEIIESQGFEVNPSKTVLRQNTERQMVTGIVVNQFANVPREYVRSVRNLLYVWEKHGPDDAEASLARIYSKHRRDGQPPNFTSVVCGRVQYIGAVKGWHNPVYLKLASRLHTLFPDYSPTEKPSVRPVTVVSIMCEGKTDVKHLEAAWRIYAKEYPQLELRFAYAPGDSKLLNRVESLSSFGQSVAILALFDSDNPKIAKQVKGTDERHIKVWSADVYTALLPSPEHLDPKDPICIELLYQEDLLLTKNSLGRRIYRKSEFEETGFHRKESAIAVKFGNTLICDNVRDLETKANIALSKNDFADLVHKKHAPFDSPDFSGFRSIFDIAAMVRTEWLKNRNTAF